MRFMILLKANKETESGSMPSNSLLAAMGKYNESLVNAGVLDAAEGLQPTSHGARVIFSAKKAEVVNGPFDDAECDIAGFWMFNVKSLSEAVEWVKRCPFPFEHSDRAEIEIRQVFETSDFDAEMTPELRKVEEQIRTQLEQRGSSSDMKH